METTIMPINNTIIHLSIMYITYYVWSLITTIVTIIIISDNKLMRTNDPKLPIRSAVLHFLSIDSDSTCKHLL